MPPDTAVVRTFGHGTLTAEALTELVRGAGVEAVVDVRRYPGSRRHPHVAREAMASWLPAAGVAYTWLPGLGGRRSPDPRSPNVGLRNAQFRAYADHMASAEFAAALEDLLAEAARRPVAVMCSETVWWRCHRRLLADHLVLVEGVEVVHVLPGGRTGPHPVTAGAHRRGDTVVYDHAQPPLLDADADADADVDVDADAVPADGATSTDDATPAPGGP